MSNTTNSPERFTASDLFGLGDELAFRRQFVTQFLASYCAANFNDYCSSQRHHLLENPPVEEAEYLSGTAWKHWCETMHIEPNDQTEGPAESGTSNPVKSYE